MDKSKSAITTHCLIRNEENWIWYAITSVIDFVDKIIIFDTGSTDRTVEIIKSIKNPKIIFEQKGVVDKKKFTTLRQEMLKRTQTPWFLILDGDEVWPKDTIKKLKIAIESAPKTKNAVVVPLWLCVGDVFHYDKFWATHTNFTHSRGVVSYMQIRAVRTMRELRAVGEYGYESYEDRQGQNISDWNYKRYIFLIEKYWHMSFLPRSKDPSHDRLVMQRAVKTRFVKGTPFPQKFPYPEVFFKPRPPIVPSPWRKYSWRDTLKGFYYRPRNFIVRNIK